MSCDLSQNFCNNYCVVLNEREILTRQCTEKAKQIEEIEINAIDDRRQEARIKFQAIYAEYTKQLKDKVGVLKMIAQSLLEEHLQSQAEYLEIEEVIQLQNEAINRLENENKMIENAVNEDIGEIRINFTEKWITLDEARKHFEASKIELEESCKTENDLEREIAKKKLERKQVLCDIKAARAQPDSGVTQRMLDKLQDSHIKLSKMLHDTESTAECFRKKICQTQREMEVIRSFSMQQFKIIKQHNEWALETLLKRKNALEDALVTTSLGIESFKAGNLQSNVCLTGKGLDSLHKTANNFKCLVGTAGKEASTCKKIIKPSMKGKPKFPKAKKILATDYLGSTFVKNGTILK